MSADNTKHVPLRDTTQDCVRRAGVGINGNAYSSHGVDRPRRPTEESSRYRRAFSRCSSPGSTCDRDVW